jgi:chorismate mutase-like protein
MFSNKKMMMMSMLSRKMGGVWYSLLAVLWSLSAGCTGEPLERAPVQPPSVLADLVAERLALAREVVWAKYQLGLPILDEEREKKVIDRMEQRAIELELDPILVRRFFTAQMAASRQLQVECLEEWKTTLLFPQQTPMDLQRQIRPLLDEMGEAILQNLNDDNLATLSTVQARMFLREMGFSPQVIDLALTW